ncbi:MAG: VWA domain-containing protein [Acidobacteriota bacterium]|nr:MAG: VWA domain-containing protein [Acidobacteriota bacterium]
MTMKTAIGQILCLSFITAFAVTALAQESGSRERIAEDVLEIETRLVEVPLAVTDKTGRPLLGLKASNFEVLEDGVRQEIESFSSESAPFEVALLLDTSGSTRSDLRLIVRAAEYFVRSLRPGDRVAIVAFNQKVSGRRVEAFSEIVSDLSEDKDGLVKSLSQIRTSSGTPFYDGLLMVAKDVFGNPPEERFRGRRALVALTDGVDSTSFWDFRKAESALARSGIVSYFVNIDTRDQFEQNLLGDCNSATHFSETQIRRYWDQFPRNAKMERVYDFCKIGDFVRLDISKRLYEIAADEMLQIAGKSGGRVFPAADIRDAAVAFGEVAKEIGSKYSLGYYSTNEKQDGSYRKITVKVKGLPPGAEVRAREGYTAPDK